MRYLRPAVEALAASAVSMVCASTAFLASASAAFCMVFAIEVAERRVFWGGLRVSYEGHEAGGDVRAGAHAGRRPVRVVCYVQGRRVRHPVGRSGSSATVGTSAEMRPKPPVYGVGSLALISARRA